MLFPQKMGQVLITLVAKQLSKACVLKRHRHERSVLWGQGEYEQLKRIYIQEIWHFTPMLENPRSCLNFQGNFVRLTNGVSSPK